MVAADGIDIKKLQSMRCYHMLQLAKKFPARLLFGHHPFIAVHILFQQLVQHTEGSGCGKYHQLVRRHIKQPDNRISGFKMLCFKYAYFHERKYIMFAPYHNGLKFPGIVWQTSKKI